MVLLLNFSESLYFRGYTLKYLEMKWDVLGLLENNLGAGDKDESWLAESW